MIPAAESEATPDENSQPEASEPRLVSSRRRWGKRLIWLIFLSPILLLLLSNAWLYSPWGKSWIAGKISARTGVDASISGAYWIPGGKVKIFDIVLLQPPALRATVTEPLAKIPCITLQPQWQQLIRGNRDILSYQVDAPDIVVTIEMLQQILAANSPTFAQSATTPPAPQPPPTETPPALQPTPPADVAKNPPAPAPTDGTASPAVGTTPPAPPAPAAPPVATTATPPLPESWFYLRNARIRLIHGDSGKSLIDLRDLTMDVPLEGPQATGRLEFTSLETLGQPLFEKTQIPLAWKPPVLHIGSTTLDVIGLPLRCEVQIAKEPGYPFQARVEQDSIAWQAGSTFQSPKVQSLHRAAGYLLAPSSWRGESLLYAQNPRLSLGAMTKDFHLLQAHILLVGGALQCSDFRLIGDEISLLGNGGILPDTQVLSVLRVVASRRDASFIENLLTRITPETPQRLSPFGNEDRRGTDFLFGGNIFHTWVSLDGGRSLLDLRKIYNLIPEDTRKSLLVFPPR
jgi:hypothetical protein